MPIDPRTGALPLGIQDPNVAVIAQLRSELADVKARLVALERAATVQTVSGTPTQPARDGTLAVDTATLRLWVRRNNSWVSATLA